MSEQLRDFVGLVCRGCGDTKMGSQSFCTHCYFRLPKDLRRNLYRRFGEGYEAAYESAVCWLRDH
jgi:hypothetical protein